MGVHLVGGLKPIHILPLGDSITQGGRADRDEFTYRLPLFNLLKAAKVEFDFVGSLTTGLQPGAKWPDGFDLHHEGHYGWKTKAVAEKLEGWMKSYSASPDIVLVHLGSNDQSGDPEKDVVAPLTDIVRILRRSNPKVVVLIGHLNFNGGAALKIRPAVEAMAAKLTTTTSPVKTVHHYLGWIEKPDAPGADTFDWAHPNPQGQAKMAKAWFEAMKPYLPKS